jgi:hypothetical protein
MMPARDWVGTDALSCRPPDSPAKDTSGKRRAGENPFGRVAFIRQRQESSLIGHQYSGNHGCRGYATCGAVRSVRARWR